MRLAIPNRRNHIEMIRERKEVAEVTKENMLLESSRMQRL